MPTAVVGAISVLNCTDVIFGTHRDAPDATDEHRSWGEVLLAATLQGAVFGGVKAAIDRAGASATRRMTETWPD